MNGWHTGNVVVSYSCSDILSGIADCPKPVTISSDVIGQVVNSVTTDLAGNPAEATVTINLDTSDPAVTTTITPLPNASGWNNTDVTLSFMCEDTGSGVSRCPATKTVATEGENQELTDTAVDNAGNETAVATALNIDKTLPTVNAEVLPPPNESGWNNSDVTVSFECNDALSGIATCAAPVSVATETDNHVANGDGEDRAGNRNTASAVVRLDITPPSIHALITPQPDAQGWNTDTVTVSFVCADTLSGIAHCPQSVAVTIEGVGQVVTGTATDIAGNSASASVTVNLDHTAPEMTASTSPEPNAHGWNNSDVLVMFTCNDSGSGVDDCPSPVTIATEGAGQSVFGSVNDVAGNGTSAELTLSIDKTPPVIQVTSPGDGVVINGSSVVISGRVTDANEITSLLLNGAVLIPDSDGNFEYSAALNSGDNVFNFAVTDIAGNTSKQSFTVAAVINTGPTISSSPD